MHSHARIEVHESFKVVIIDAFADTGLLQYVIGNIKSFLIHLSHVSNLESAYSDEYANTNVKAHIYSLAVTKGI